MRIEFHCHTIYSGDSLTTPEKLLAACRRKGIDRVVVTDHNTIAGALEAKKLDPDRVVVGQEVMTTQGELLAAFVKEEVPSGMAPLETIDCLREQNAFISVSHPFDRLRSGSWSLVDLEGIVPHVDAIETFNARCMSSRYNYQAQAFAKKHGLAGTSGSDAHAAVELGTAAMLLPDFLDADSLRTSLLQAEHQVRMSGPWVHLYSRYAAWYKSRNKAEG